MAPRRKKLIEVALPLVAKVADLAHTWIFAETQNGLGGSEDEQPSYSSGSKKARRYDFRH